MILGLDISTSITGYTILDDNGNIVDCSHIDLRKHKNFFQKVLQVENVLKDLRTQYSVKDIYIEQSLQSFRSGFSSAQTLSLLSKMNGVVSWLCYNIFDKEPQYFGASSARKSCGIKIPKGQKAKQVVLNFLLDNEPAFEVEYTRHGNPKPGYYDRADSIIIARAGWLNENRET